MKRQLMMTVAAALLAAGCAGVGQRSQYTALQEGALERRAETDLALAYGSTSETKDDDEVVCETWKRTGSHLTETICRSAEEVRAEREKTQRFLRLNRSVRLRR